MLVERVQEISKLLGETELSICLNQASLFLDEACLLYYFIEKLGNVNER